MFSNRGKNCGLSGEGVMSLHFQILTCNPHSLLSHQTNLLRHYNYDVCLISALPITDRVPPLYTAKHIEAIPSGHPAVHKYFVKHTSTLQNYCQHHHYAHH